MTNEEAKKMLKAKLECLKRETSGTDIDCNYRNCDECNLCYEQGNMGEQKEALDMAIKALEQTSWIPVSEKPQEGRYLCTYEHYDGKCIDFGSFDGEAWYIKPIAYMPLPQPYKALEQQPSRKWKEIYAESEGSNSWIEFKCPHCGYSFGMESGEYDWHYGDEIPWKYCPICGGSAEHNPYMAESEDKE